MFSKSLIFLKTGWRTCPQNVSGMAPRFRSTLNSLLFMSEVCGHKFYRPIPPPPIFINGTHALPFPVLARSIHKRAVNVCCSSGRITFYTSLNKDPSLRFFFFFFERVPCRVCDLQIHLPYMAIFDVGTLGDLCLFCGSVNICPLGIN